MGQGTRWTVKLKINSFPVLITSAKQHAFSRLALMSMWGLSYFTHCFTAYSSQYNSGSIRPWLLWTEPLVFRTLPDQGNVYTGQWSTEGMLVSYHQPFQIGLYTIQTDNAKVTPWTLGEDVLLQCLTSPCPIYTVIKIYHHCTIYR